MIDPREINIEIERREITKDYDWGDVRDLASLYVVRDHLAASGQPIKTEAYPAAYSASTAPSLGRYGDTDFLRLCAGKDPESVMIVVDELMSTLALVNERAYNRILRELEKL